MKKTTIFISLLLLSIAGMSQTSFSKNIKLLEKSGLSTIGTPPPYTVKATKRTDTTFVFEGRTVVANIEDTIITFVSVDGRQITSEENAKAKSCMDKMKAWCYSGYRPCRDYCVINEPPILWNPACLLNWAMGCLIDSIF